jgi:surface antigen
MRSIFASIRLNLAGRAAVVSLLLALSVLAGALPATAQINPFGQAGGNLTREDWAALNTARDKALADPAAVGTQETWSNPRSGNSGAVTITGIVNHAGMDCRAVTYTFHIKVQNRNATHPMRQCKTADGAWKFL